MTKSEATELLNEARTKLEKKTQTRITVDKLPVAERFRMMEMLVDMVVLGTSKACMVFGDPGIGKTYMVMQRLEEAGLQAGVDYEIFKGHSSPMSIYQSLHDNRDSLIVYDDCDSVLKKDDAQNILKAALDSYSKRTISWLSRSLGEEYERQFDFTGRIIFVSNMTSDKCDDAVKSRCHHINISLTKVEVMARLRDIKPFIAKGAPEELKDEVLEYLDTTKGQFREFSMRTFLKSLEYRQMYPADWKVMTDLFADA